MGRGWRWWQTIGRQWRRRSRSLAVAGVVFIGTTGVSVPLVQATQGDTPSVPNLGSTEAVDAIDPASMPADIRPPVEEELGELHALWAAAVDHLQAEDYGSARDVLSTRLALTEATYGPDHPETARISGWIAWAHLQERRPADAEPLLRRALTVGERTLGPDHPNTLHALTDLAFALLAQDQYGEAEPLARRALTISERVLGPEHPETLNSLSLWAMALEAQGRHAEAEPLILRALDSFGRVLEPLGDSTGLAAKAEGPAPLETAPER